MTSPAIDGVDFDSYDAEISLDPQPATREETAGYRNGRLHFWGPTGLENGDPHRGSAPNRWVPR